VISVYELLSDILGVTTLLSLSQDVSDMKDMLIWNCECFLNKLDKSARYERDDCSVNKRNDMSTYLREPSFFGDYCPSSLYTLACSCLSKSLSSEQASSFSPLLSTPLDS
jgi:hypothetical protein